MGFFSELKKDLSNAVDEIDPEEKTAAEKNAGQDNAGVEEVDLDSMLSHLDKIQVEDIPEPEESVAAQNEEPEDEPEEVPAKEFSSEPEEVKEPEPYDEPDFDAITFPTDPISTTSSEKEPEEEEIKGVPELLLFRQNAYEWGEDNTAAIEHHYTYLISALFI